MLLVAGCYSSDYGRLLRANSLMLRDLAAKLADYCVSNFHLGKRKVSSEEMGEFYYALKKADSVAAIEADRSSERESYRAFLQLVEEYRDFLRDADQYRLARHRDPRMLDRLMRRAASVKRRAQQVIEKLKAESA
jgi:hypothetical protein